MLHESRLFLDNITLFQYFLSDVSSQLLITEFYTGKIFCDSNDKEKLMYLICTFIHGTNSNQLC